MVQHKHALSWFPSPSSPALWCNKTDCKQCNPTKYKHEHHNTQATTSATSRNRQRSNNIIQQAPHSHHKSHWTDTHRSQSSISYPWTSPISKHQVLVVLLTSSTIATIEIRSYQNIQTWNSRHTSPCSDKTLHNMFHIAHTCHLFQKEIFFGVDLK